MDYEKDNKVVVSSNDDFDTSQNAYYAYMNEISKYKLLSADEEVDLFIKIQNGDSVAKELFVNSNLRLVVKCAKTFYTQGYNDLLDLIQEGNIGLLKAVERFDPAKGCRFSTFATYWINRELKRLSVRTGLPLVLPENKAILVNKIKFAESRFRAENGCSPSTEELASILNVSIEQIISVLPFAAPVISLQQSSMCSFDDNREVIDFYYNYYESGNDAENEIIAKELKREFTKIMSDVLSDNEAYILRYRWGFCDANVKKVEVIAKELGMSEQGIRQAESRAICKLNKYLLSMNKTLSDFV